MKGAPNTYRSEVSLARAIASRSRVALKQAVKIRDYYVSESFTDSSSFIEGTASHRLSWLPKINPSEFRGLTFRGALRRFYTILQYYGVGLEQAITDQVLFDGKFLSHFQDSENHLTQLLCQCQMSTYTLGMIMSPDVTRNVMRQEYRNVGSPSQRLIRNYLILRDYADALNLMTDIFQRLAAEQMLNPTEVQTLYDNTTMANTPPVLIPTKGSTTPQVARVRRHAVRTNRFAVPRRTAFLKRIFSKMKQLRRDDHHTQATV